MSMNHLPEDQVRAMLDTAGLLAGYRVQMLEFDEARLVATERAISIVSSTAIAGDEDVREIGMDVYVIGKPGETASAVRLHAENVLRFFLSSSRTLDVIRIVADGAVVGPYRTDTKRPICEMSVTVIFSN